VDGTKEKPDWATDVISDIRPTIHQHSLQRNESINQCHKTKHHHASTEHHQARHG
jgi:hypothetical protein